MMRRRGRRRPIVLLSVLLGLFPLAGSAQPSLSLAEARQDVASGEIARMERGLRVLAASRAAAAVGPIEELLRRGPPAPLLLPAIEALGALGRAEATPVLSSLLRHHRADARARAAIALGPLRSERASIALSIALGDPDATVRAAAARALATAGTPSAVAPLLAALTSGNTAAAPALGAIGEPDVLEQVVALGDAVPRTALASAARAFLARTDIGTRQLLHAVDVVAAAGGPEIAEALRATQTDRARVRALAAHIGEVLAAGVTP